MSSPTLSYKTCQRSQRISSMLQYQCILQWGIVYASEKYFCELIIHVAIKWETSLEYSVFFT